MFAIICSQALAALLGLGLSGRFRTSPPPLLGGPAPEEHKELERRSEEGFTRQLAQLGRRFAPTPAFEPTPADQNPLTPAEYKQRALDRCRRSLATFQAAIKKVEEEPDPRVRESKAGLLKTLKELEANELRRIAQLERPVEPVPWMPMSRPSDPRPRSIRD